MNTLLLSTDLWDLVKDASGNIAIASDPYSVAQDVASAIKTFLGEVWYNTTLGILYFQSILGQRPSLTFIKAQIVAAALTVPGCTNPVVYISSFTGRAVNGQVQFTDSNGTTQAVNF